MKTLSQIKLKVMLSLFLLCASALLMAAANYSPHPLIRSTVVHSSVNPSIYYGVYAGQNPSSLSGVKTFEYHTKKGVSIIMWYQGWGVQDNSRYFEAGWMNNVRNHGSIPMVSWEPWNYTKGLNQPTYSLQNIINGSLDAYITKWALASKAWGSPYFLRFAAEMNGNWYPWSEQVNGNSAGQYIQAWQHVHDIFTTQGVTNVTWVWSPNVEYGGSIPLSNLYPGSAYVDWIGMDGYNWSTVQGHKWQSFSQVFQATYQDILAMNLNKPLMVAETASAEVGGNKAQWISDAFTQQIPNFFPAIKSVIWFDDNKETDWRIESSASAQAAFATAIGNSRYAANQFGSLAATRIQVMG